VWQAPNNSEAQVRNDPSLRLSLMLAFQSVQLLTLGVNRTLRRCVKTFNPQLVTACKIYTRDGVSRCRVDTGVFVDSIPRILQEAKSPTVMEYVRGRLPQTGVTLRWTPGGSLLAKLFLKVASLLPTYLKLSDKKDDQDAVYLGLGRLEWLFLTCHNSSV
jgi:hypothetical protein